jgi:hypothetical protein
MPPANTWTQIQAPLSEGAWVVDHWFGGPVATQAQVQWVLAHLTGFYVLQEWWSSSGDDSNLDNVQFGSGAASSFAAGSEAWLAAGPDPTFDFYELSIPIQALAWDGGFGNPAGSARISSDLYTWTWFAAPAAFHGDQSSHYGETLSVDLYVRLRDNAAFYPVFALVAPDVGVPEPGALAWLGLATALAATRRARR